MINGNGNAVWTRWVLGTLVSIAVFFGGFIARGQTVNPVVDLKRIELLERSVDELEIFNLTVAERLGADSARYEEIMRRLDVLEKLIRESQ